MTSLHCNWELGVAAKHQHHLASFCQSMVAVEIGQFLFPLSSGDNTNFVSNCVALSHIKNWQENGRALKDNA